jgi:Protein of unknown function (DUF3577)
MSESSVTPSAPSYFNLHVEGVGYLNRVRTIKPKKGQAFLACTVAALRGSDAEVGYTKFDCRVSGADAQEVVRRLEADVNAEKSVLIGFRIADIYPELFTFEKGERKGETGVAIKGRLLRIKFAKVNGQAIDVPQPARPHDNHGVDRPAEAEEDTPF